VQVRLLAVILHPADLLLDAVHDLLPAVDSRQVLLVISKPDPLPIVDEFVRQVEVVLAVRQQGGFTGIRGQDRQPLLPLLSLQTLLEFEVLQRVRRFHLFIEGQQSGLLGTIHHYNN
jgi:hypothetical protein